MDLSATGRRWAIATPHTLATEAGAHAFERGGNAIDAALAAAVTLAVTYPHMCGVGGDLFAVVRRAGHDGGDIVAVNSSGRAPRAADPEALRAAHGSEMPGRGPAPITVPGAVAGWEALHRLGARLPWAGLFERPSALAHDGTPMPATLGTWLAEPETRDLIRSDPGLTTVLAQDGEPIPPGAPFRNPALGRTLEALAAGGPAALYRGPIGAAYVEGLRAAGSPLTVEDLATHEASILSTLSGPFRDVHVHVAPPNTQGYSLLQILGALERLGLDPDPLGSDAGMLARVFLVALRDVRRHLADPERMVTHVSTLLDDGHLAALCDEARGDLAPYPATPAPRGDTIALVAADAQGHAVSLVQSVYEYLGSGILEPTTGILAHDRGACFTLEPGLANSFTPGALPLHTLLPALLVSGGELAGVAGTKGGFQQPQIDAQTIARAVGLDLSPAEAVAAPRWIVEDLPWGPGWGDAVPVVLAEARVPDDVVAAVEGAGFGVARIEAIDGSVGHAHLIRSTPEGLSAGSDPRADGGALAG
jgi:gamma-glutamyltranspeptidase/glutathione hydrolase